MTSIVDDTVDNLAFFVSIIHYVWYF